MIIYGPGFIYTRQFIAMELTKVLSFLSCNNFNLFIYAELFTLKVNLLPMKYDYIILNFIATTKYYFLWIMYQYWTFKRLYSLVYEVHYKKLRGIFQIKL